MKVLVLLNSDENHLLDQVYSSLQENDIDLETFMMDPPNSAFCLKQDEILAAVQLVDVVVYFASRWNKNNVCLNVALQESARLNKKIVCISLDEHIEIGSGFEQLGDSLINSIADLPAAIADDAYDWRNADGSSREDRPFKRYKCGEKK